MSLRKYSNNAEESEKAIEAYLVKRTKEEGGLALKFSSAVTTGYPDRILIFPDGVLLWVEIKSKGKNPTKLQSYRIAALRDCRQNVFVCDSKAKADYIIKNRLRQEFLRGKSREDLQ